MCTVRHSLLVLALVCFSGGACQPASDLPRETAPAESSEPPPPPPPLPTETAAGGGEAAADSTAGAAPVAVAETAAARTPSPSPPPQPPAAEATRDCRVQAPPPTAGQQRLTVFFSCGEQVQPVQRVVPPTRSVLRTALEQLLRGPSAGERAAGLHSFFGDATAGALRSVVVRDGVAHIDFADFSRAIPNASSSAGSTQLLDQLRATVFQYPSIRAAEITFEGSCDAFWDWLQRGCMVLRRE